MDFGEKVEQVFSSFSNEVEEFGNKFKSDSDTGAKMQKGGGAAASSIVANLVGKNINFAGITGAARASSSDTLLEAIRKFEYDYTGSDKYGCASSAFLISGDLRSVSSWLSSEWNNVYEFLNKVMDVYEEELRLLRSEMELYAQSSIGIEEELATVIQNVFNEASRILSGLGIVH